MKKLLAFCMLGILIVSLAITPLAWAAEETVTAGDRSTTGAMWLSIAHPGLGEYYLKGWGNFWSNCPQRKFWLGAIPLYGWPGYLQVLSAIDAKNGRTGDNITPVTE